MTSAQPLVLTIQLWPLADRIAWQALFAKGDLFEEGGAASDWSEGSRIKRQQGYGQWLSYLARTTSLTLRAAPADRIIPELVRGYLEECELRLKPRSISGLFTDLYLIARSLDPSRDWSWLRLVMTRLTRKSTSQSLPPAHDITAAEIFEWSIEYLTAFKRPPSVSLWRQAIDYRRALIVGFLIARPIRRRSMLAICIGTHMQHAGHGFKFRFGGNDMKDKREREFSLPDRLISPMQRYLSCYRPILLNGQLHSKLWVTHEGNPFTADGLATDIEITTKKFLGIKLNPHAFRSIAATSIAEVAPQNVGIIRDILGHATLDMAEKHYNRASGISSCNGLQSIVEDIRKNMPKIRRADPIYPSKLSKSK